VDAATTPPLVPPRAPPAASREGSASGSHIATPTGSAGSEGARLPAVVASELPALPSELLGVLVASSRTRAVWEYVPLVAPRTAEASALHVDRSTRRARRAATLRAFAHASPPTRRALLGVADVGDGAPLAASRQTAAYERHARYFLASAAERRGALGTHPDAAGARPAAAASSEPNGDDEIAIALMLAPSTPAHRVIALTRELLRLLLPYLDRALVPCEDVL